MNTQAERRREQVLALRTDGVTYREIARKVGINRRSVGRILAEAGWTKKQRKGRYRAPLDARAHLISGRWA